MNAIQKQIEQLAQELTERGGKLHPVHQEYALEMLLGASQFASQGIMGGAKLKIQEVKKTLKNLDA